MSSVIPSEVRRFLDTCQVGVLGTTKPDGSPRLATVVFVLDGDKILVSSEADKAKVRDVARTGRAALCVHGPESPYPSVCLLGPARLLGDGVGAASAKVWEKAYHDKLTEAFSDDDVTAFGRTIIEMSVEAITGRSYL